MEPEFYAAMLERLGLDPAALPGQMDVKRWPELRKALAGAFAGKTRDEWADVFEGTVLCVCVCVWVGVDVAE